MIGNWLVSAWLASPLAGDPPQLDAVLAWELSRRLGSCHHLKLGRDTDIKNIPPVPLPLSKATLVGQDVFRCSSPILPDPLADWHDHAAKRFDTDMAAWTLRPSERKSLLIASGPYKMRFVPVRLRLVPRIGWFIRGDRKEVWKLLKGVQAIGSRRGHGYGLVSRWEFTEQPEDYSLLAPWKGQRVLMRPVPVGPHLDGVKGYRRTFAACTYPYWHPQNYQEVAAPC